MEQAAELKTIDQSGIRALVEERLYNPAMFIGKPLIIWRSYAYDGVNNGLALDIFREYRKCRCREEWKGFVVNTTIARKDMMGICFIDTSKDYSRTLAKYGDLHFENADKSNRKGCDFPVEWSSGVSQLGFCLRVSRLKKICEVEDKWFNKCFQNISTDLVREFRQYLIEHQI